MRVIEVKTREGWFRLKPEDVSNEDDRGYLLVRFHADSRLQQGRTTSEFRPVEWRVLED